jgi:hypothetical protein
MADRNAARVLPDPVGATTSTSCSEARASQAPTWAWVGAAKAPSNQPRVRAENRPSPPGEAAVAIEPMLGPRPDSAPSSNSRSKVFICPWQALLRAANASR